MSSRAYYHVHVLTGTLQLKSIFVGSGTERKPLDEAAAARLVESNLERLTGDSSGHIMPIFVRPSLEPPNDIHPTTIDGVNFYVMPSRATQ